LLAPGAKSGSWPNLLQPAEPTTNYKPANAGTCAQGAASAGA
jgi:hypothetical protein